MQDAHTDTAQFLASLYSLEGRVAVVTGATRPSSE
jgi:hypothetical protein